MAHTLSCMCGAHMSMIHKSHALSAWDIVSIMDLRPNNNSTVWFVSSTMDLFPKNKTGLRFVLMQSTWIWTLNYLHSKLDPISGSRNITTLLIPFPSGSISGMIFPEWDIWQVKSWTRFLLWLCEVSSSLLQNNKCLNISTIKTLIISKKKKFLNQNLVSY